MSITFNSVPQRRKRIPKRRVFRKYPRVKILRDYYLKMLKGDRWQFRQDAMITDAYLQQIYGGWSLASYALAVRIERASKGKIRPVDLGHSLSEASARTLCDCQN